MVINGVMLGLTRAEILRRFDEIVEFSEMKDFIDAPVKTYSSGMYARLGFSVAAHVDPDVLLVDEVLSVGDYLFQHKCIERMNGFRARGATFILVSHSPATVLELCDRAIWIDHGRVRADGPASEVVAAFTGAAPAAPAVVLSTEA